MVVVKQLRHLLSQSISQARVERPPPIACPIRMDGEGKAAIWSA
jgi:hypothetical protein